MQELKNRIANRKKAQKLYQDLTSRLVDMTEQRKSIIIGSAEDIEELIMT